MGNQFVAGKHLSDERMPAVIAWIEQQLGGKVVSSARQARWRPMYFVDLERDGETMPLLVRGDRIDTVMMFPLEHEMLLQKLMFEHGIAVPRVYGWIDEPRCYVMDRIVGTFGFENETAEERASVMREYMKLLADCHKLPVQVFKDAGIAHADDPSQAHLFGARLMEEMQYRAYKQRPDPFLEFVLAWLKRNPPKQTGREAVIAWDTGQFHQKDGKLLAALDVEIGHIGDPMMDLAAFRMRDTIMHYGDIGELYRIYEEFAGEPVDLEAIKWHHLFFTLSNALAFHVSLAAPVPESDYMTNLQWVNETNLFALEAMAEYLDIELDKVAMPEPETTQVAVPFQHLVGSLTRIDAGNDFVQHQIRILFRLARHLQRWDQVGRAMEQATFDDVAALVGRRPSSWQESEQMLEDFVLADDGAHDAPLIHLFNRKLNRALSMNGPVGSAMARHNPIQRFDGRGLG
jgi:aminoglycoside phosphotransferase (APT) family kinase protein